MLAPNVGRLAVASANTMATGDSEGATVAGEVKKLGLHLAKAWEQRMARLSMLGKDSGKERTMACKQRMEWVEGD